LKTFIDKASKAYYEGNPILSDAEFDSLAAKYNYNSVGHSVTDGTPHLYRMYSLEKESLEDITFITRLVELETLEGRICTPKLDGAAISIVYVNGYFAVALTRGDGNLGRDITDKISTIVPRTITHPGTVQITGEVVCPESVNNSRNAAAGSLNLKSLAEFRARPVTFVAYDAQSTVGFAANEDSYADMLDKLALEGFNVITRFDASNYPTDGMVCRVPSNKKYNNLGFTSHHPRGAIALKSKKDGVVTTLEDVVWQVGKSGAISPVGILTPVLIGDAEVSRATLHNIEYIRDLDLEIGCSVEVIRSGEIIPRILRRVDT